MKKPFSTVVVAIGLSAVCTIAPAISPAMSPAWADNAVSTTATDFVTASDGDCANGATVDDAAAAQARQRVEAVGYTDVQILNKSCDNSWRATGIKGGETRNLVVTPDGGVLPGGN
jgi:hypothetical protein